MSRDPMDMVTSDDPKLLGSTPVPRLDGIRLPGLLEPGDGLGCLAAWLLAVRHPDDAIEALGLGSRPHGAVLGRLQDGPRHWQPLGMLH